MSVSFWGCLFRKPPPVFVRKTSESGISERWCTYHLLPDEADAISSPACMNGCESTRKSLVTVFAELRLAVRVASVGVVGRALALCLVGLGAAAPRLPIISATYPATLRATRERDLWLRRAGVRFAQHLGKKIVLFLLGTYKMRLETAPMVFRPHTLSLPPLFS